MTSERDKMLAGQLYDPYDAELSEARVRARDLFRAFNLTTDADADQRRHLLNALFGYETDVFIEPPFFCDYGANIKLGRGVFFNFNCVVLDVAGVTIGDRAMFGPAVQILTAMHPITAEGRQTLLEYAKPVVIGDDVWVGGGAIICPGVSIGAESVIGAGSVVTRDIPDRVVAVGNPCRVLRQITDEERGRSA